MLKDNTKKIVFLCYHYLSRNDEFKRIWAHSIKQFKSHVIYLKNNYPPIDFKDIDGYLEGKEINLPNKCSVITFDDGLKEQAEVFAKYLDKYNIKAVFSIPGCILDNKPANPQIIHYGTAYYGIRNFYGYIKKNLLYFFPEKKRVLLDNEDSHSIMDMHKAIKKILWRELGYHMTRKILLEIYNKKIKKDFPDFMDKVYLSKKDIKELSRNGHSIALHTYSHFVVGDIYKNSEIFNKEIIKPRKNIQKLLKNKINIFSYPFGSKNDTMKKPELLNKAGYKYILTTYKKNDEFNKDYIGRYLVQSKDTIEELKNNIWEYEISNNK